MLTYLRYRFTWFYDINVLRQGIKGIKTNHFLWKSENGYKVQRKHVIDNSTRQLVILINMFSWLQRKSIFYFYYYSFFQFFPMKEQKYTKTTIFYYHAHTKSMFIRGLFTRHFSFLASRIKMASSLYIVSSMISFPVSQFWRQICLLLYHKLNTVPTVWKL